MASGASCGPLAAARADGGFTVIELLIAFTILAIVAGSLFQIFYVAAANNAKAEELDRANSLAVTAAELFKADSSDSAGYAVVAYYDSEWRELSAAALPGGGVPAGLADWAGLSDWSGLASLAGLADLADLAGGEPELPGGLAREVMPGGRLEPAQPAGAAYALVAEAREEDVPLPTGSNYMLGAAELTLGPQENHRIVITEGAGGFGVLLNGLPQAVDGGRIQGSVPINVVFGQSGFLPKNVVVANSAGIPAQISVFGLPGTAAGSAAGGDGGQGSGDGGQGSSNSIAGGAADAAGMADAADGVAQSSGSGGGAGGNSAYIRISAAEGSVAVTYFQGEPRAPESKLLMFGASVLKIAEGGEELARLEAKKYVPG
jgi:hypothetical protein